MKIIGITGGAGFVGRYVTNLLISNGYKVLIFTRNTSGKPVRQHITYAHWDPDKGECDTHSLELVDAIVHLAGEGIADKRWSPKRKQEIVDSRVKVTHFLVEQLKMHAPDCKVFVSAAAIGYYGPDRQGLIPFTETAPSYNDFLGDTCSKWEVAANNAAALTRTVILRFGIVLGKESGAFPKFSKPVSFGIMPILGSGRQVVSWIEVSDLARLILFSLEHSEMQGIYNAVAPIPVTHRLLMKTIAREKGGIKIPIRVPAFALKILMGEMSEEILKSCTVSAQKTLSVGYTFLYPEIKDAIKHILNK